MSKAIFQRYILYICIVKRIVFLLTAALLVLSAADNTPQQEYIEKYAPTAVAEMYRTGVPASITLAQGILESRSGLSELASKGNNHFGIKCHSDWKGKTMTVDDDAEGECFRVYKNAAQSFQDHSDFLRYRDRYKFLFSYEVTDYKSWAYGLKKAGYATDPAYASKLIRVVEEYGLSKYDSMRPVDLATSKEEKKAAAAAPDVIPPSPAIIEEAVLYEPDIDEEFTFSLTRPVYKKNGVKLVRAYDGETYASIAARYHLFPGEILRFNDLKESEALEPGTEVYIQAKKNQAEKGLEKYIVESDGESFREISQRFAVKESAIRKMNGYAADYVPREGATVLLRKPGKEASK